MQNKGRQLSKVWLQVNNLTGTNQLLSLRFARNYPAFQLHVQCNRMCWIIQLLLDKNKKILQHHKK